MTSTAQPSLPRGCVPRCPGCAHRLLAPTQSEARKSAWLARRLAPWREALAPLRAIDEDKRWGYRDRLCLSAAWVAPRWQLGLLADDEVVDIPACPVHSARARNTLQALADRLPPPPEFPLAFYVQSGAHATLIVKSADPPDTSWADASLSRELENAGLEALWLHTHPSAGRVLFHKNGWHRLWGAERSRDNAGLWYGPDSFQQLIGELYHTALDDAEVFLGCREGDSVVDLYCGLGASLLRWTRRGARTLGVEIGGEAVACARLNAPEATVLRGKCGHRVPQLRQWTGNQPEDRRRLFVNPPRTGLEPDIVRWIIDDYRPHRMAYLSCSAGTLARDLEVLEQAGFGVERITPYNFFPQTYHVEALALLRRG